MVNIKKALEKHWPFLVIFIVGLFVSWPLFKSGYFWHQDDLQVIRIVEMRKCFSDFQIPCRWAPDMAWGNGMPLFNFYGVAVYYAGAILSYFFGFLISAKILFFIALIVGSFAMYLLVNKIWGKYAGLTSAIFYMLAPYKALDIYVRGALSEGIALAIIPFVLYFVSQKKYKLFSLSLFVFLITHNIMTIIFLPVLVLWIVYWLVQDKFKDLKLVILSFTIALGMSAFFIIPAFLEKSLVQTESLTRFELDFRANFISLKQLFFDRVWGYGTSIPGPEGGMNFQIGWPYWTLAFISVIVALLTKCKKYLLLVTSIFLIFLLSIFMTHNKSAFIWERISILQYFQFPWRFLSLTIFTSSILAGYLIFLIKEKWQAYTFLIIVITTIILNLSYFKPREYYDISEIEKTSGLLWEIQQKGAILDYLPKTALEPREKAEGPIINSGIATITNFVNKSNSWKLTVEVQENSEIILPVYYFPNWEVSVNGQKIEVSKDKVLGRILVPLEVGRYEVSGKFTNTPLRTFANTISLISLVLLILIWKK